MAPTDFGEIASEILGNAMARVLTEIRFAWKNSCEQRQNLKTDILALKLRDAFFGHVGSIDSFFQALASALEARLAGRTLDFSTIASCVHSVNSVFNCMLFSAANFRKANRHIYLPVDVCTARSPITVCRQAILRLLGHGKPWFALPSRNNARKH